MKEIINITDAKFRLTNEISGDLKYKHLSIDGWYVEKCGICHDKPVYEKEEEDVIKKFIKSAVLAGKWQFAEALLYTLADKELSDSFYQAFTQEKVLGFLELLDSKNYITKKSYTAKIYDSDAKYSILELLKDLRTSKVMLLVDPELIGSYKPITATRRDKSSTTLHDKWCEIVGLTWNSSRANLSVAYNSTVSVTIPENEFGVTPGNMELKTVKSRCIVKDCLLYTPEIAIKTNDKDLVRKLKHSGIIKGTVCFSNEFVLDLTRIPVIRRATFKKITPLGMSISESSPYFYETAHRYLSLLSILRSKKIAKLPEKAGDLKEVKNKKEIFLNTLGIYGDTYIAPKLETVADTSYVADEVVSNISYPDNYSPIRTYINTGKTSSVIAPILKRVDKELKHTDLYILQLKYMGLKRKSAEYLKEYKFISIINKSTLSFIGHSEELVPTTCPSGSKKVRISWTSTKTEIPVESL